MPCTHEMLRLSILAEELEELMREGMTLKEALEAHLGVKHEGTPHPKKTRRTIQC